jgi:hypothetical protein
MRRTAPLCLYLAFTACAGAGGGAEPLAWTFDGPLGAPPAGWRVETTNPAEQGAHARWEIRAAADAPSPPACLALVDARGGTGQAYNLCWTPDVARADVDLEVAVRKGGGAEDAGGGPAWRIASAGDYYLARWNPLEYNLRLYYVAGGKRVELASADVYADLDAWHRIRVTHVGAHVECAFDGRVLLRVDDATHAAAGGVGVWTKADATTSFDDLRLR